MNHSRKQSWTHSPARRVISLFITVIWLATVLQPCVMASVVDSGSSNVESHHSIQAEDHADHLNNGPDHFKHDCPLCDTFDSDDNHCDAGSSTTCDSNDSYVYSGRIKPVEHEKFHYQYQPLKLLNNPEIETQPGQLVAFEIGNPPPVYQGRKLTDLYRVYLK